MEVVEAGGEVGAVVVGFRLPTSAVNLRWEWSSGVRKCTYQAHDLAARREGSSLAVSGKLLAKMRHCVYHGPNLQ